MAGSQRLLFWAIIERKLLGFQTNTTDWCQDFVWWILRLEFDQALNIKRSVWGFFLSCLRFPCQEVPLGKQIEVTVGLHCRGKFDQDSLNFEGFKSGRSSKVSKNRVKKKSLACLCLKIKQHQFSRKTFSLWKKGRRCPELKIGGI